MPSLAEDSRRGRALRLAFRWLAKATRASEDEDQLFSHFIGIETLLNAYAADNGPVPEEQQRRKLISAEEKVLRKALGASFDAGRLAAATLFEKFRFYATAHDFAGSRLHEFRSIARTRNDAFHGDVTAVDHEQIRISRDILVEMLKTELGIDRKLVWETTPRISNFKIFYDYKPEPPAPSPSGSAPSL